MTFDNQYLTYNEYISLGGEQIGETPFNLLEFEARNQIDLNTKNRLVGLNEIPQKVKICVFNLINRIENYSNTIKNINGASSENIDGYSITYAHPTEIKEIVKSKNNELRDIILSDLYGVIINNEHIIYLGD